MEQMDQPSLKVKNTVNLPFNYAKHAVNFLLTTSYTVLGFELGSILAGYALRNFLIPWKIKDFLSTKHLGFLHAPLAPFYESSLSLIGKKINDTNFSQTLFYVLMGACSTILIAKVGHALLSNSTTPAINKESFSKVWQKAFYPLAFTTAGAAIGATATMTSFAR